MEQRIVGESVNKKDLSDVMNIGIVVGLFVIAVIFWNNVLLYPIKLFVVALHELSHGVAAVLVGGRIEHINIDQRIGGYCAFSLPASAGFFKQAFVATAGYLGSMIWGAAILMTVSRSRFHREITFIAGILMMVISFYVIRTGALFGIVFCFSFTLFLFAAHRWFAPMFHKIFLKFLGLTSCLYVLIDIKEDLIDRTGIGSDADRIAQMMGMPGLSVVI
ncbi:MAG TPA: M50 family metallopeptidase, partial [Candidatus Deferrimicrobium sp.]|nr:M50 family metallopeptidase [Candidatus Deferrimicrobium sp.]